MVAGTVSLLSVLVFMGARVGEPVGTMVLVLPTWAPVAGRVVDLCTVTTMGVGS